MELFNLKYLDLALPSGYGSIKKNDEFHIKCYFNNSNHIMHSNNPQINSLVDMVISLGKNLEEFDKRINNINAHIHNCLVTRNKLLSELIINNDYIKNQNNDIIKSLKELSFRENTSIILKIEKINDHYRKIKLLLEELKHLSLT